MKIKMIGFGYTKNLGNDENCKLYLEAELEDWEDASKSINLLRDRVAFELGLSDKLSDLKGKLARQLANLEGINRQVEKAESKLLRAEEIWKRYAAFLAAHGVDPKLLTINSHPDSIAEAEVLRIAHELDAVQDLLPLNEGAVEDDDDDYFDPYYGDEYDRLHDRTDDEDDEYHHEEREQIKRGDWLRQDDETDD